MKVAGVHLADGSGHVVEEAAGDVRGLLVTGLLIAFLHQLEQVHGKGVSPYQDITLTTDFNGPLGGVFRPLLEVLTDVLFSLEKEWREVFRYIYSL